MRQCLDCGVMEGFGHHGYCVSFHADDDDSPKPKAVYGERLPYLGRDGLPVYPLEQSTTNGWSSESIWSAGRR